MRIPRRQIHSEPKHEQASQGGEEAVFCVDANIANARVLESFIHPCPAGVSTSPFDDVGMFKVSIGSKELKG